MIQFTSVILKFEKQGEKTGWTYIEIPADIANRLKKDQRKSFRVKGKLDRVSIRQMALLPMGNGNFILPLNSGTRKKLGKRKGEILSLQLESDDSPLLADKDFIDCLKEVPEALQHFNSLAKSHQNYFSKWIESAKTDSTKAKRIVEALKALSRGWGFPEMLRSRKSSKPLSSSSKCDT